MSGDKGVDILLVDDRAEDLLTLRSMLDSPRYHLLTARSGPEALRHILRRDFAVLLIDVRMPNMDGFELATLIRQRERARHTPIIFLTAGDADVSFIYQAYSVGAVDYLIKPIDPAVVRAKVAIFVDLFRKDQRIREQSAALVEAARREREHQVEELRRASDKRYRDLANAIPQIVWTAQAAGELTYVNSRWQEYTGMSTESCLGWGWLAALHPEEAPRCEARWRGALGAGGAYEEELRLRRADGVYRWHLCRAVPERSTDDRITGWLGTYTDCEDLKQALHIRDEFLSIASHELRTPLTGLMLDVDGLRRSLSALPSDTGPPDRVRGRIERVAKQAQRLDRLIDNLLDVSRLTNGRLTLDLSETDLSQIVRQATEGLSADAARAGSAIDLRIDESAPAVGRWDAVRVEQIAVNLLSNAIKYGAGRPINVQVESLADVARLVIRDQGIGIAAEDLPRIFKPFQRAVPLRQYGGMGVGLYIVRQITEAHGGHVQVQSELGAGSAFTVELPWSNPGAASRSPLYEDSHAG